MYGQASADRPKGVPGVGRLEGEFRGLDAEVGGGEPVDARIGLEDAHTLDRENIVEERCQSRPGEDASTAIRSRELRCGSRGRAARADRVRRPAARPARDPARRGRTSGDKITGIDLIADPERRRQINLVIPTDH